MDKTYSEPSLVKHHRKCRSWHYPKNKDYSMVTESKHKAWHTLFLNAKPNVIAGILNKIWVDSDYYFTVRRRND